MVSLPALVFHSSQFNVVSEGRSIVLESVSAQSSHRLGQSKGGTIRADEDSTTPVPDRVEVMKVDVFRFEPPVPMPTAYEVGCTGMSMGSGTHVGTP